MSSAHSELWAITSLFNPAGYQNRLVNYRQFRAALDVPLATIELTFSTDGTGDRWELTNDDADLLVRVSDADIMWQKERLLNILIKHLPPECKYVAWLDSDVLLQDPDWPERTIEQLRAVPITQLFSELIYLDRDGTRAPDTSIIPSTAAAVRAGQSAAAVLEQTTHQTGGITARGMAWAARRELLEQHGFYDSFVIGAGDTALLCAAYGVPEIPIRRWQMSPGQRDRYLLWSNNFYRDVQGNVGSLTGEIHHLWHGDLQDRRYILRHSDLMPYNFDPSTDVRPGADGAWRWASHKPEMHALLRDYFHSRNEDGATQPTSS